MQLKLELSQEQYKRIEQDINKYNLAVIDAFDLCQQTSNDILLAGGNLDIELEALNNIETVRGKILNMYKLYQELLSVI